MKLKLYLRMVVAVMVAMLTATGCNSSKEEPVGPVNDPLTFQLEVSDIGTGKATVAVKPNKDTPTYYCGAMEKSVYDAFASEADFLAADLKRLQNLATQNKMTLKAYLETNTYRGEGNRTVMTSAAKTAHYAYVYGIKADGMVTSTVYKVEFISGDVPAGPVVDLKMWPGDDNGANKSVMLSFSVAVTKSPAVSSKYYFDATSEIEKALAAGQTYESLAASSETAFNAEMITEMNSPAGLTGYAFGTVAKPLPADTSCTLIVLVTDANGVVSVEHVEAKTDPSSGGGDGPTVTVTVAPGKYPNGGDPTTQVHLIIESDPMNVTAGKYLIAETSAVQAAIDGGMTYESLVSELGTALDAEGIGIINDGGLVLNMKEGTCKPGTSYTGVVLLTNPSGTSVGHGAGSTTGGGGGGELTFTFSVTEITATAAKIMVTPSNNTDTYYFDVIKSSSIKGLTDAQIITALGANPSKYPSQGVDGYNPSAFENAPLETGVEHTVFAFGYANGAATTAIAKYTFTPTGGGGDTPSDAYKAWLGTWTVTSTSSEVNKKALSFDVTFAQNVVNASYKVSGWGITAIRTNEVALPVATLAADGTFAFAAGQQVATTENGPVQFTARIQYSDKQFYGVSPAAGTTFLGLAGTMNADKASANVVGGQVEVDNSGTKYTIHGLDMFVNRTDGKLGSFTTDPQFTEDDYPMGPYTMTKKQGASAPARSMSVNLALRSALGADKGLVAKMAVGASNIPQFSSVLKISKSAPATFNGLQTKFDLTKLSSAAYNAKPKSATYEMVRVK